MAITTAAVIDGIFADAATGDLDRVLSWWADDGILEDVTLARALHGKDALRTYLEMYFSALPDLRYTPIRQVVAGPTAMVEWAQEVEVVRPFDGIDSAVGSRVFLHAIDVFHVAGGKVQHEVSWYGDGWLAQRLRDPQKTDAPPALPVTPAPRSTAGRFS